MITDPHIKEQEKAKQILSVFFLEDNGMFLILALTTWPFYLNKYLVIGILTLLYSIQIFNEWLRHRKKEEHSFYFLVAGLLFVLAGFQFVEYFYYIK